MLSLSLVYRPTVRAWNVPTIQNMAWARAYGRRIYQVQAQMQSSLVWVMGLPLDAGYPYMYTTRCAGSAEPLRIPKMQNRRRTDSAHSGNHVEHPCALAMSCATHSSCALVS